MEHSIRKGRYSDKESLAPWTSHTFAWGDYVVDSFDAWLAHRQSHVLVAADDSDKPIAVARGVLLSPDELWLQGIRVHPDWRRRGVASALGQALQDWGTAQGARVAQLMTEDWNEAARRQVSGIGFRETSKWLRAFQPTEHSGRVGAQKVRPVDPLRRAGQAEAGPAFYAWSAGELSRLARRMISVNWQWRRLHPDDLERAADHGALFAGPTGWAIAAPRDSYLEVGWIQTTADRVADHLTALLAVAGAERATALEIMAPEVGWLQEAATSGGFELESLVLYEKPL